MISSRRWRASALIFLFGLSSTLFVRGSDIETTDELLPLYSAVSLIDHGDFDLPSTDIYHPDFFAPGAAGRTYPKFAPGQALVLAPFAAAARAWRGPDDSPVEAGDKVKAAAMFFGPMAVAAIAVAAFAFWLRIGYSASVAASSSIALIAATSLLPYSRTLFGDVTCACLELIAFLALAGSPSVAGVATAAAALGASVVVRPVTALFIPAFALYMILRWRRARVSSGACRLQIAAALIGFLPFAVFLLAFNAHAFGSPWTTGYRGEMFQFDQSPIAGIRHNLFSLEKGLFVYSPILLLSIAFWRHFHRAHPDESVSAAVFSLLYVWVYGCWYASSPGLDVSYGQRFLLPAIPFIALALPECVARMSGSAVSAAGAGAIALSAAIQFAGSLQRGAPYREWASQYAINAPSYLGYLWKSFEEPGSIDFWWWQSGGWIVMAGLALAGLSIFAALRAICNLCVSRA